MILASLARARGFWKAWLRVSVLLICAQIGCGPYLGTTSQSFIRHARTNPDPNIRYIAYAKLGVPSLYDHPRDKAEAVDLLIDKFQEGKEPLGVRSVIIHSLGNLGDPRAHDVVVRAVNDPEPVIRVEGCRALGKVGRPQDATTLARIMTVDTLEDCRIAAIEGLGSLKAQDPRIFQILVDGMDHEDPAIRLECLNSLRKITGKDYGVDPVVWKKELAPILGTPPATVR
jgi:HEAT repeats